MRRKHLPALFFGKPSRIFSLLSALGIFASASLTTASARDRLLIDSGWRFRLGDPLDATAAVTNYPEIPDLAKLQISGASAEFTGANSETNLMTLRPDPVATHAGESVSFVLTNYNDNGWRAIDLPHDWVVELPFDSGGNQSHGYKAKSGTNNIAWYRHTFTLPSTDSGKTVWLEFDGIYRNALIWLNGHCIGRDVSGYASIHFDVTPYANPGGTNVLVVRVDASRNEGWFYEGGGIYRHGWLVKTDPVHVAHWGTYVATTSLVGFQRHYHRANHGYQPERPDCQWQPDFDHPRRQQQLGDSDHFEHSP